jgi:hypothetical protein
LLSFSIFWQFVHCRDNFDISYYGIPYKRRSVSLESQG